MVWQIRIHVTYQWTSRWPLTWGPGQVATQQLTSQADTLCDFRDALTDARCDSEMHWQMGHAISEIHWQMRDAISEMHWQIRDAISEIYWQVRDAISEICRQMHDAISEIDGCVTRFQRDVQTDVECGTVSWTCREVQWLTLTVSCVQTLNCQLDLQRGSVTDFELSAGLAERFSDWLWTVSWTCREVQWLTLNCQLDLQRGSVTDFELSAGLAERFSDWLWTVSWTCREVQWLTVASSTLPFVAAEWPWHSTEKGEINDLDNELVWLVSQGQALHAGHSGEAWFPESSAERLGGLGWWLTLVCHRDLCTLCQSVLYFPTVRV